MDSGGFGVADGTGDTGTASTSDAGGDNYGYGDGYGDSDGGGDVDVDYFISELKVQVAEMQVAAQVGFGERVGAMEGGGAMLTLVPFAVFPLLFFCFAIFKED